MIESIQSGSSASGSSSDVPPWAAGAADRMQELDPELSPDEIELLKPYGEVRQFPAGETLWQAGDPSALMVVIEGAIAVQREQDGEMFDIIEHGPGHYVGEIITMSGGRALVSGIATQDLIALVVESDALRQAIATEADLGEKLLHSFILRRMRMIAENLGTVDLVGDTDTPEATEVLQFLSRNGIPCRVFDPQTAEAVDLMLKYEVEANELPVVVCHGHPLRRPSNREVAECLGFTVPIDCSQEYDVAVVGSGPAGMAAAVYAASEGLKVLVLESCAPGGQAASSSKIENYMGFPTGISGQALMGRGYLQAQKFGAQIAVARELVRLEGSEPLHKLHVDGNQCVRARTVVLATGAIYRQPAIDRLDQIGGVHYGAGHIEGQLCAQREVAIVGGGNSAGQAAVFLSRRARHVHLLIRGPSLSASMSDYLIQRIDKLANVTLHRHTEIDNLLGEKTLSGINVRNNQSDKITKLDASHLFIFIGAQPGTGFVNGGLAMDERGFVLTGNALDKSVLQQRGWPLERRPFLLETSCPRIFAAGDVRSGSVKRVASAVGEGSVCVQFIHQVLQEIES